MSGIERVKADGKLIALIIRGEENEEGINFYTSEENPLQVGLIVRDKDTIVKPHFHRPMEARVISETQEILHVLRGRIEVDLYDENREKIRSCVLEEGDTILLASGGHGVKIYGGAKILEIKQGPYLGDEKIFL